MVEYITVEEMRALEANADYFGVSYGTLMENARENVPFEVLSGNLKYRLLKNIFTFIRR